MEPLEQDHPEVIAHPPLIALLFAAASAVLHFTVSDRMMSYPVALVLGFVVATIAGWLALSAERVLKESGTNIRPDRPAHAIVRQGPYKRTRNPMYVALLLLQLALGFVLNGWVPIAFVILLAPVLHFGVVLPEERYLERKFGAAYTDYRGRVRRWI